MLLDAGHAALESAGCSEAFLYTHEQNERAIHVYEAAGYRRDDTVRESNVRGWPPAPSHNSVSKLSKRFGVRQAFGSGGTTSNLEVDIQ